MLKKFNLVSLRETLTIHKINTIAFISSKSDIGHFHLSLECALVWLLVHVVTELASYSFN